MVILVKVSKDLSVSQGNLWGQSSAPPSSDGHRVLLVVVPKHNELKRGKKPFWQDNTLFASKAKINDI